MSKPLSRQRRLALAATVSATLLLPLAGCTTLAKMGVGPGISDPGTRTTAMRLTDINLGQAIRRDIYRDVPAARDARIEVTTFYQSVLLTGEVQSQDMKGRIGEIARGYEDVRAVHNELSIGPTLGFGTRSSDSLLESKANISLSTGSNIRSGQTNVVAVNGTLYLMGKLTQRETDRAIVRLQALDGVKRIVKIVDILPEQASDAPSI